MLELLKSWHAELIVGVSILVFETFSLVSDWRFRKRALRVVGEVVRYIRYSKHISYYIAYQHDGRSRVAEYYAPELIAAFKEGEKVDILVDREHLPDVKIPEGPHVRWSRSGNCIPADTKLVSVMDVVLIGAGIVLLARGLT